jgi:succinoglycan biosynthesis protein ExoA
MVIVDGHCEIDDERFLHNVAAAFESSGADCLGRPQPLDASQATPLQRAIAAARSSRLGHHPDSFIYSQEARFVPAGSVAVAYRRSVFEQVGYFDETFDACEDYEFNHRVDKAGLRCYFTPDVAVKYVPRGTLRKLFCQLFRYGRGRVRLLRKYPGTFSLGTVLPAVWVLGLVGGMLLSMFSASLASVYLGALSFYGLAVLASTLSIVLRERNLRLAPWLPPVFFIIHTAAGMGLLAELFARSRKSH